MKEVTKLNKSTTLMVSMVILLFATLTTTNALAFSDIEGNWAESTIQQWKDAGRISGYPDDTFQPNSGITRAELTSMMNPLFGFTKMGEADFTDVQASHWYDEDVRKAVAAGIISGYPDGTFGPNQLISRQEIAVMLTRVLSLSAEGMEPQFQDADQIPAWSAAAVARLHHHGLMSGSGAGMFRPADATTRAEAIVVLERAHRFWMEQARMQSTLDEAGVYGPQHGQLVWEGDLTITSPDVVLQHVQVTGDLHLASDTDEGELMLDQVDVLGTTKMTGGGSEPIYMTDSALQSLLVDHAAESVCIVLDGQTDIQSLDIRSATELQLGEQTSIEHLMVSAPLTVTGQGTIAEALLKTNDVTFEREPLKLFMQESDDEEGDPAESGTDDPADDKDGNGDVGEGEAGNGESGAGKDPGDPKPTEPTPTEPQEPAEPLILVGASASIGGQSVTATMDGNTGRVSANSFADSDRISGFSIQTSDNVDRVSVSAFGIHRTMSLTNGSASLSISDILGSLDSSGEGITMGTVRKLVGDSTSVSGTLISKDGHEQSFEIQIQL